MSEKFNPVNESVENIKIPTEGEVLSVVESFLDGREYSVAQKLEDGEGLYLLRTESVGDDGDKVEYEYLRAGNYPECGSISTVIRVVYFDREGIPVGGDSVSKYVDGKWVEIV